MVANNKCDFKEMIEAAQIASASEETVYAKFSANWPRMAASTGLQRVNSELNID